MSSIQLEACQEYRVIKLRDSLYPISHFRMNDMQAIRSLWYKKIFSADADFSMLSIEISDSPIKGDHLPVKIKLNKHYNSTLNTRDFFYQFFFFLLKKKINKIINIEIDWFIFVFYTNNPLIF